MTTQPKLVALAGSLRAASFNKKLVRLAAESARAAGAEVIDVDLKDYPMPIYNQDEFDQQGFPESVIALKAICKNSNGFLIASPEYNGSISGGLKNAIDWLSRAEPGESPLALSCFKGKVAVLMATSPGGLGGLRGLSHVRQILEGLGTLVLPDQKAIPGAVQAFDATGQLVDEAQRAAIATLAQTLVTVVSKLH